MDLLPLPKKKRDQAVLNPHEGSVNNSKATAKSRYSPVRQNNKSKSDDPTIVDVCEVNEVRALPPFSPQQLQSPQYDHISPNTKQLLLQSYEELKTLDSMWQTYHVAQLDLLMNEQKESLVALLYNTVRPGVVSDVVDIAYNRNLASDFEKELEQCKEAIQGFRTQYITYMQNFKEREVNHYREIIEKLVQNVQESKRKFMQKVQEIVNLKAKMMQYEQIIAVYQAQVREERVLEESQQKAEVIEDEEDYINDLQTLDQMAQKILPLVNHADEFIFYFKLEGILEALKEKVALQRSQLNPQSNPHLGVDYPTGLEPSNVSEEEGSTYGYNATAYEADEESDGMEEEVGENVKEISADEDNVGESSTATKASEEDDSFHSVPEEEPLACETAFIV